MCDKERRDDVCGEDLVAYLERLGYQSIPGWQERCRELHRQDGGRARRKILNRD